MGKNNPQTFNRICKHCNELTKIKFNDANHQICSVCGKPYNEYRQYNTVRESKIEIGNRCDRVINDMEVIKQELVFSHHFSKAFVNEEVPIINYWLEYIRALSEKIKVKKITNNIGLKPDY